MSTITLIYLSDLSHSLNSMLFSTWIASALLLILWVASLKTKPEMSNSLRAAFHIFGAISAIIYVICMILPSDAAIALMMDVAKACEDSRTR